MDLNDPQAIEANEYAQRLLSNRIVYRYFTQPVANIVLPEKREVKYSLKGYIIPFTGPSYQFITNLPLRQYWSLHPNVSFCQIQGRLSNLLLSFSLGSTGNGLYF